MTDQTAASLKPVPEPTIDSEAYWAGLREGRLVLQSCGSCGKIRHYPKPICPACYSFDVKWKEASGRGTVHSWTITHHAFNPGFKGELPYILVTVDLPEGVRMHAPLRNAATEDLRIGLPVRIIYEPGKDGLVLPAFVIDA